MLRNEALKDEKGPDTSFAVLEAQQVKPSAFRTDRLGRKTAILPEGRHRPGV